MSPETEARIRALLRDARTARDSLTPHDAARAAWQPGGPPVEDLEALIIRQRAAAARQLDAAA